MEDPSHGPSDTQEDNAIVYSRLLSLCLHTTALCTLYLETMSAVFSLSTREALILC